MSDKAIKKIKSLGFPWETADPFLFCVYHQDDFPKGNEQMGPAASLSGRTIGQDFTKKDGWRMYHGETVPGFPQHPHKGFETVTIVEKGLVDHSDSLGAAGRFGNGDVQWMTAGKGVLHSEMFPLLNREGQNPLILFQIWLNLPKKSKLVDPYFAMLWAESIPVHHHKDQNSLKTTVTVIAGQLGDTRAPAPAPDSWAALPDHEVAIWTIRMEPGAEWDIPMASAGTNRSIYFYEGDELSINSNKIRKEFGADLVASEKVTLKNGSSEGRILLLQGKPIAEEVVQYGPFVMNTREEIQKAFQEYQRTQFGGWPWPNNDHVHARDSGRFAKYADGRVENK